MFDIKQKDSLFLIKKTGKASPTTKKNHLAVTPLAPYRWLLPTYAAARPREALHPRGRAKEYFIPWPLGDSHRKTRPDGYTLLLNGRNNLSGGLSQKIPGNGNQLTTR